MGSGALVPSWDELVGALSSGYPVTICAKQRFTLHRDQDGFSQARGIWGHCVLIAGVRFDRPGACIMQSWGPDMADGPCALDQPTFSFWADQHVIERILAEGDSWALSKAPGIVQRPLPQKSCRGNDAALYPFACVPAMVIRSRHKIETLQCKSWASPGAGTWLG